jgi:chromosomal replication initiator protein
VVLTTDRHPSELYGLKDRLLSRFKSGLIVDVQAPNLETRIAILQKKAEDDSLEIPYEIIEFIATNIRTNIREMEGALIKLLAYSSLSHSDITMSLAKRALRETLGRPGTKTVSIEDVIQSVSEAMDVPEKKLVGRGRKMDVSRARQVAMYLSREIVGTSLENIGMHFGGRDHSTVIHACRAVKGKMKEKADFCRRVDGIRSQLEF